MKKIIVPIIASLILSGCGNKTHSKKRIAITQIVDHPSLNEAKKGIIENLGNQYDIIEQDAQGDPVIAQQIAKRLISKEVDLVVAISTPSAQAFQNIQNPKKIPILFSSVTYPKEARLVNNYKKPENITGVYDAPVIENVLSLSKAMIKDLKTIGVIYNAAESNSEQTVKDLINHASDIKIRSISVHNSCEVIAAVKTLASKVDMIYIPSDNTVWPALESLTETAKSYGIPVFSSDPDSAKRGVTIALGYAQYDLGKTVAKQIKQILEDRKTIAEVPVQQPERIQLYVNKSMLTALKLTVPENLPNDIKVVE